MYLLKYRIEHDLSLLCQQLESNIAGTVDGESELFRVQQYSNIIFIRPWYSIGLLKHHADYDVKLCGSQSSITTIECLLSPFWALWHNTAKDEVLYASSPVFWSKSTKLLVDLGYFVKKEMNNQILCSKAILGHGRPGLMRWILW